MPKTSREPPATRAPHTLRAITTVQPRRAPQGLTLPVPLYTKVAGGLLGLDTLMLGLIYLLAPPERIPALEQVSVVAVLEPTLGWAMITTGLWVVGGTLIGRSRASAHMVATVCHCLYFGACVASFLLTVPPLPTVAAVLALGVAVAHGGACLAYWQRGWR